MNKSKNLAATLALVAVGTACGYGIQTLRSASAPAPIAPGDFSGIIAQAHHRVALFTRSTCPYCRKARAWLDANRIDYALYEIDTSPAAESLYKTLDISAVPILMTEHLRIIGFNENVYGQNVAAAGAVSSGEK